MAHCSDIVTSRPVTYVFTTDGYSCIPYDIVTAYLNIKYNRRTPQGWLYEVVPPSIRSDLVSISSFCAAGDLDALINFLRSNNATLILAAGDTSSHLRILSAAACSCCGIYVFR